MATNLPQGSVWQQLRAGQINYEQALGLLVDPQGCLNITLLDEDVCRRFFQCFSEQQAPPVVPLLLWQNWFYLGCPKLLSEQEVQELKKRTLSEVRLVSISAKSYRTWHMSRRLDFSRIQTGHLVDPLTGETLHDNIGETTELFLSKAEGQIERIKAIISSALHHRASDVHLEPMQEGLRVRYRIDGVLRNITTLPTDISRRVIVALKVMANMDIADSRRPQDGRIGEQYAIGQAVAVDSMDMRVSTLPCVCGEKAVIRLLPRQNPFSTIDKLGFSQDALAIYRGWLRQPQGMVIFTGPTGSGKTSTLYTSLQEIATEDVNVVTVEDPVEYILPAITQTQVNEAAGMTFTTGLRAILRQDPDIIMVGEIRDHATAETAVRAALTGHLVFTTLHTNDAVGVIPRMKDIGPDVGLICDALLGVVAQRLVRRICPHCSAPTRPNHESLVLLGLDDRLTKHHTWRKGQGCNHCFQSGYLGREAIIELLQIDDPIRDLMYDGTITQLHRYLNQVGFMSFRRAAIEKVLAGVTTLDEVIRVLPRNALNRKLEGDTDFLRSSPMANNGPDLPAVINSQTIP